MTDPYLICHKVRGLPAFDVAEQLQCPHCIEPDTTNSGCHECDGLGYWWIIPTSGHRAYPWRTAPIVDVAVMLEDMPEGLPDHYPTRGTPTLSLAEALGITKPKAQPAEPFTRRRL